MATVVFYSSEAEKSEKHATLMKETVPFYIEKFENIVAENNGYFVNGKVIPIIYIICLVLLLWYYIKK